MIVWGGTDSTFNDCNTGGRYSPNTDSWIATSTGNAPSPRDSHTAVWTGSEMIVWGGIFCCPAMDFNTGGRYNPGTDSWVATSIANAPFARENHTAVWTGSQMIVWGGIQLHTQPVLQHRRSILRTVWTDAYANAYSHRNCYGNCDSNSYTNTDVYAESDTYTENSSDAEGSPDTTPTPIVSISPTRRSLQTVLRAARACSRAATGELSDGL